MWPPKMLQYEPEFNAFVDLLLDVGVRSYLEIGCKFGGTLWRVGMALPTGSMCVGVDFPRAPEASSFHSMRNVIRRLQDADRGCTMVWGDSTDRKIIDKVRALGPFDACFIDANHSRPYVEKDWQNYGQMTKKVVAFHDICWQGSGVPKFWNEVRAGHHYSELRYDPGGVNNGIGVIYVESNH